jgi:hypothetical protein
MHQRSIDVSEQGIKFALLTKQALTAIQWTIPGTPSLPCCKKQPTYRATIATAPGPWQMSFLGNFEPPKIGSIN